MSNKLSEFGGFFEMDTEAMNLLGEFFEWMKSPEGANLQPGEASPLAHDADRYLRDFMVEIMELRPSDSTTLTVTSYLGNWYEVNTLEPSHSELDRIARSLILLHNFLEQKKLISADASQSVGALLSEPAFFHERLDEFWELTPESIEAWRETGDYRKGDFNRRAN